MSKPMTKEELLKEVERLGKEVEKLKGDLFSKDNVIHVFKAEVVTLRGELAKREAVYTEAEILHSMFDELPGAPRELSYFDTSVSSWTPHRAEKKTRTLPARLIAYIAREQSLAARPTIKEAE